MGCIPSKALLHTAQIINEAEEMGHHGVKFGKPEIDIREIAGWKDGIVERLSTGGRAAYYGLAPNEHHKPHPHFYCKVCGQMDCLNPESLNVDTALLWKTFPGRIDKVEVRVDGICKNCVKQSVK